MFQSQRIKMLLILMTFMLLTSAFGYALATLFSPPQPQEPVIKGTFTMDLEIADVNNLYSWQVGILFNAGQLKVLDIAPGGFVGDDYPLFVNSTDSFRDLLLLGGTLYGNVPGKDGAGKLATIVFGYLVEDYVEPTIVEDALKTFLLNCQGQLIPTDYALTLTVAEGS